MWRCRAVEPSGICRQYSDICGAMQMGRGVCFLSRSSLETSMFIRFSVYTCSDLASSRFASDAACVCRRAMLRCILALCGVLSSSAVMMMLSSYLQLCRGKGMNPSIPSPVFHSSHPIFLPAHPLLKRQHTFLSAPASFLSIHSASRKCNNTGNPESQDHYLCGERTSATPRTTPRHAITPTRLATS